MNEEQVRTVVEYCGRTNGCIRPLMRFKDGYKTPFGYPTIDHGLRDLSQQTWILRDDYWFENVVYVMDHFYDKAVIDYRYNGNRHEQEKFMRQHIRGIRPIIDIDAPKGENGRVDITEVLPELNTIIDSVRTILGGYNVWNKCRMMSSGNGVYIILPDYFGNDKKIKRFYTAFYMLCKQIEEDSGVYGMLDYTETIAWQRFHKVPYTKHLSNGRIALPIDKDRWIITKTFEWSDYTW